MFFALTKRHLLRILFMWEKKEEKKYNRNDLKVSCLMLTTDANELNE